MEDKRLTTRLTIYWNNLRKDLPLPQSELFNPAALTDIMGKCCMWRVEVDKTLNNKNIYMYEFVGQETKEALGVDMTGKSFSPNTGNFPGARIVEKIDEVVNSAAPLTDEGQFVNKNNKVVKYRSCLLPFGTKEGKVSHILLGLSWRAF